MKVLGAEPNTYHDYALDCIGYKHYACGCRVVEMKMVGEGARTGIGGQCSRCRQQFRVCG